MMSLPAVGFIGLGTMGGGMALNLVPHVEALHVFDAYQQSVDGLVANGAVACATPADVAQNASIIFLCLPFAPEVREVLFGENGITSAAREGLTVIDTTTLDRTDAIAIAQQAKDAGIAYCDSPISGLPKRAADGTLTIMVGGEADVFTSARPYLDHMGTDIIHCGDVGAGQAMKAINNIIYNINIVGFCEVLPLAVKIGLDPEQLLQLVTSGSSRSFASEHFVPKIMTDDFEGDFPMGDAYKDIVNVQRMAVETRAQTPVVNAMVATYQATMTEGHDRLPKSAMIKHYEHALGVKLRRT